MPPFKVKLHKPPHYRRVLLNTRKTRSNEARDSSSKTPSVSRKMVAEPILIIVQGERGEDKHIPLDREYVEWLI